MPHTGRYALAVALASFLGSLSLSCGGSNSSSTPSKITTTTTPASPPPVGTDCPLGMGSGTFDCQRTSSQLLPFVEEAMDRLISQRPQLFELDDDFAPGSHAYRSLDRVAYMDGVVANLQAQGLCAERDVYDIAQQMIFAKSPNDFSEEFDVVLSTGHMRRGSGAYRTTCTPAAFPLAATGDEPPPGSGCYTPFPPPIHHMRLQAPHPRDGFRHARFDALRQQRFLLRSGGVS